MQQNKRLGNKTVVHSCEIAARQCLYKLSSHISTMAAPVCRCDVVTNRHYVTGTLYLISSPHKETAAEPDLRVHRSGGAFLSDSSSFPALSNTQGNKNTRRHPSWELCDPSSYGLVGWGDSSDPGL